MVMENAHATPIRGPSTAVATGSKRSGLAVKGLSKRYGKTRACSDISLDIAEGEYLALLGPTGAGKTTLLRCISGLERGYEGQVTVAGRRVDGDGPDSRDVAFLSQEYSLFPHMSVWQNTAYGPSMKGLSENDVDGLCKATLAMVRLEARMDAYPGELSGGMKQRNALARALAYDADVLLLDEPLRALDARLRIDLRYEIHRLCKEVGKTTIHVTHDQEEALTIADRVAVMKGGRILQVGTPEEVYNTPVSPFVQHFVGGANFLSGKVHSVEGESATMELGGGFTLAAPVTACGVVPARGGSGDTACARGPLRVGGQAVLSIKHDLTVLYKEKEKDNTLHGMIKRRLFAGLFTTLAVELDGGAQVVARVPSAVEQRFHEGDSVCVHFPTDSIRVFAMDAKMLAKDLEVL